MRRRKIDGKERNRSSNSKSKCASVRCSSHQGGSPQNGLGDE